MVMEEFSFENSREIIVKKLPAWFIEAGDVIDETGIQDKVLELLDIDLESYAGILSDDYPYIYLYEGVVTKYCDHLPEYDFFPTVEYANHEECYIRKGTIKKVSVILSSTWIMPHISFGKTENKESKPIQKTYLMVDGNGYYKIGKSYNPTIRESTLQSENPTIELIAICDRDIESELHDKNKQHRKRGEWFELSKSMVSEIIKDYGFKRYVVDNG